METHLLPQILKPVPQLAMTQAPASHLTEPPVPGLGQLDASQVEAPQPYFGSSMETQLVLHNFEPEVQLSMMQAPALHASVAPSALGQEVVVHRVGSQP